MIGSELQELRHDVDFDDLLYYRDKNGDDRLALIKEGNQFASIALSKDIYEEVGSKYRKLIAEYGDATVIDMEWVMRSVSAAAGGRDA